MSKIEREHGFLTAFFRTNDSYMKRNLSLGRVLGKLGRSSSAALLQVEMRLLAAGLPATVRGRYGCTGISCR